MKSPKDKTANRIQSELLQSTDETQRYGYQTEGLCMPETQQERTNGRTRDVRKRNLKEDRRTGKKRWYTDDDENKGLYSQVEKIKDTA